MNDEMPMTVDEAMTVDEVIAALEQFRGFKLIVHEFGAPYDRGVTKVYRSPREKKKGRKVVVLRLGRE